MYLECFFIWSKPIPNSANTGSNSLPRHWNWFSCYSSFANIFLANQSGGSFIRWNRNNNFIQRIWFDMMSVPVSVSNRGIRQPFQRAEQIWRKFNCILSSCFTIFFFIPIQVPALLKTHCYHCHLPLQWNQILYHQQLFYFIYCWWVSWLLTWGLSIQ